MTGLNNYRWRKTSDINREFATFELLANEIVILDIGFSQSGILEIAFHEGIAGVIVEWERLQEIIDEGRKEAELDR